MRKNKNIFNIFILSLFSSTFFFLVTNAAVWMFSPLYNSGFAGLLESLMAGVPFYKNMMMGDLIYTALFFGAYESVKALHLFVRPFLCIS
jgi:hypothetical protein